MSRRWPRIHLPETSATGPDHPNLLRVFARILGPAIAIMLLVYPLWFGDDSLDRSAAWAGDIAGFVWIIVTSIYNMRQLSNCPHG